MNLPTDRWQHLFGAAEIAAQRSGACTIETASEFDAILLLQCMEQSQPMVFHSLPQAWSCAHLDAELLVHLHGGLSCRDEQHPTLTLVAYVRSLHDNTCQGTGGFRMHADLASWAALPSQLPGISLAHPNLFGGAKGATTPWHRDAGDGLNIHVLGRKLWRMRPPTDSAALLGPGMKAHEGFQVCDAPMVASFFSSGRADQANTDLKCVVNPGEAIFIPSGWFHEVSLLDAAMSIAVPLHRD